MANAISSHEAAALLRKIIAGEITLSLEDRQEPWATVAAGDVCFLADGYRIVFFNDCGEMDYVDHILSPDGRKGDFDTWWANQERPLDILNKLERCALEMKLEEAR